MFLMRIGSTIKNMSNMSIELDFRGMNCPLPVVNTKKHFDSIEEGDAIIIVDNEVAKDNLLKFAASNNFESKFEQKDELFYVSMIKTKDSCCEIAKKQEKFTIAVGSNVLGNGDEKLGNILIKSYMFALSEASEIPTDMIFFNSGVKLTVEDAETLVSLNKLTERGVKIQVCGTCLDFYNIKDKIAVGEISNMYSIVETMNSSDKVINL